MANKIQVRRGLKANIPTLSSGEIGYTTDTRETFVGTGSGNVNVGGSHWYRGTAMSGTVTTTGYYSYSACPQVKVDDIYLNTSNGNVYACTTAGSGTTAKWTYQVCIKGVTGDKGDKGDNATAEKWLSVSSVNAVQNSIVTNMLFRILNGLDTTAKNDIKQFCKNKLCPIDVIVDGVTDTGSGCILNVDTAVMTQVENDNGDWEDVWRTEPLIRYIPRYQDYVMVSISDPYCNKEWLLYTLDDEQKDSQTNTNKLVQFMPYDGDGYGKCYVLCEWE